VYKINLLNFAHYSGGCDWESLVQCRKIARICALCKSYAGVRAWKAIGDKLQALTYLSNVDLYWKIRGRKQRKDIGKYSFVNRYITEWNHLPKVVIGVSHGKTHVLKTKVRKVKTSERKRMR
jgi:hypothetical protein